MTAARSRGFLTLIPFLEIEKMLATTLMPLAAAGYSLVYLLMGGGLGGAVLIFIVAKALKK